MKIIGATRISRSTGGNIAVLLFLILVGIFFVMPMYLAILNSFKPIEELMIFPPRFYAQNPTLSHYKDLFLFSTNSLVPFSRYIFNSLFLTIVMTVSQILVAAAAAFPLAKLNFPGKRMLNEIIVTAMLFTSVVTAAPLYIIMTKMGLVNSYFALILPGLGGSLGVFLMRQFMEGIPYSLIEATRIDGGGDLTILFRVVMPLVKPAWLTLAIFGFQSSWGSTGSGFIFDEELKFFPTAISQILSGNGLSRMGTSAAASVLMMAPPIIFFILSQSRIIETMAHAGIKE